MITFTVTGKDLDDAAARIEAVLASESGRGYNRTVSFNVGTGMWIVRDHGELVHESDDSGAAAEAFNAIRPRQ